MPPSSSNTYWTRATPVPQPSLFSRFGAMRHGNIYSATSRLYLTTTTTDGRPPYSLAQSPLEEQRAKQWDQFHGMSKCTTSHPRPAPLRSPPPSATTLQNSTALLPQQPRPFAPPTSGNQFQHRHARLDTSVPSPADVVRLPTRPPTSWYSRVPMPATQPRS